MTLEPGGGGFPVAEVGTHERLEVLAMVGNTEAREPTCSLMQLSSSSNTSHNRYVKISGRM